MHLSAYTCQRLCCTKKEKISRRQSGLFSLSLELRSAGFDVQYGPNNIAIYACLSFSQKNKIIIE